MHSMIQGPARVLLALEHPVLIEVSKLALNHGAYSIRTAQSINEMTEALTDWRPHLVIIDMDIGDGGILDHLEPTRLQTERIPVIAFTRRGDLRTKLAAFEWGVDDILVIPFSPEEFIARVLAVMRRTYSNAVAFMPRLQLGELEIDVLNRSVHIGGHQLHLTSLEQNLLYLLAANAGRLMTRDEILDHLWGTDFVAESNVVDRHIRNLRAKLQNDYRRPRYIATVPGKGYRFVPVSEDQAGETLPAG